MLSKDFADWAVGIAQPLRQLALAGADDDELQRFIDARRCGDSDQANRLLQSATSEKRLPAALTDRTEIDEVSEQVTIAALRPVVNNIDTRLLHGYVELAWHLSRTIVAALKHDVVWSSERTISSIGGVVATAALDRINRERG